MKLYLPITVDLYNIYPLRVLNLQQNNVGRGALITLTAAGAVIVPDSESLYVYAQKPDGTVVYNTCTLKDNQIQVDFDEQMTAVLGILQVELQMVDTTGNSITTPIFQVNVQKSNIDYQKIASSDEFQALIDMINSVDELKKTGLKGDKGDAATIQVGTVTASEAGSVPTITNRGTAQKAIFDFVLPRGEQGPRGQAGPADATDVSYNNGTSGAAETNAQDALDKLYGDIAGLREKNTLKIKNGTYVNVIYNDTVVILQFLASDLTLESNKINTQIALPNGILPTVEMYFVMPMMTSSWYPLNRDVYFTFQKNNKNPKIRLVNGTTSESNVVVTGYITLPRGYFSITD